MQIYIKLNNVKGIQNDNVKIRIKRNVFVLLSERSKLLVTILSLRKK